MHFLLQKFLYGRLEHQSNKSILDYHIKCLDDPSDKLVQSIEYGRWAKGTKLTDGTVKDMDSSGDVGLFCRGLLDRLLMKYGDRLKVIPGEEGTEFHLNDRGRIEGVTTRDESVSLLNIFLLSRSFIVTQHCTPGQRNNKNS